MKSFLFSLLVASSFFLQIPSLLAIDPPENAASAKAIPGVLALRATTSLRAPLEQIISSMALIAANPEDDAAALFDLRLALRRSFAALTLYSDLLPQQEAQWVREQLTQLRIVTDEIRDDDVAYQILMNELGCESYPFGDFKIERNDLQQPLLALLEGFQKNDLFKNKVEQMLAQVAWPAEKGSEPSFQELAKQKLSLCLTQTFISLPDEETSFVELHRFRIRIKKLHYMVELLEDVFSPESYSGIYPQLVLLQSTLGRIHDLFNLEQRIEQKLNSSTGADAAFFQTLLLKCGELLQQSHQDFFENFTPAVFQKLQDDIRAAIDLW